MFIGAGSKGGVTVMNLAEVLRRQWQTRTGMKA